MDVHHRQVAALENRIRLMNPALFIVLVTVTPHLISPIGLNPTNPAPGMTPTTFRAIKIASQCFWPLNSLALVSALAALLVLIIRTPLPDTFQDERVSIVFMKMAYLSTFLWFVCFLLIRLISLDSLLPGLYFVDAGVMFLVYLCLFFRLVKLHDG